MNNFVYACQIFISENIQCEANNVQKFTTSLFQRKSERSISNIPYITQSSFQSGTELVCLTVKQLDINISDLRCISDSAIFYFYLMVDSVFIFLRRSNGAK